MVGDGGTIASPSIASVLFGVQIAVIERERTVDLVVSPSCLPNIILDDAPSHSHFFLSFETFGVMHHT